MINVKNNRYFFLFKPLKRNKLLGNSVVYIVMSFVQKAAGFLLLPFYTSYLSPEQFGQANVVNAAATIFMLLFSLALDDAVVRFYFEYKLQPETRANFLGSVVLLSLFISILGSGLLFVFQNTFFRVFVNKNVSSTLIMLGIITIAASPLFRILQKLNIIEEKPFYYTLNAFGFFLINTLLCVIFIVKFQMKAEGILLAAAIVNVIFFVYSLISLNKRMKYKLQWRFLKESLYYSLPLVPNRLSSWGLVGFNKIYLGKVLSNASVGIYNVANYFGLIITVIANSVSLAFQPFVYKMLENGEPGKKNLKSVIILLSSFFSISGFGLTLFSVDILDAFINKRYSTAGSMLPIIIWSATVAAISSSYQYILFYYKNTTKHISYSTVLGAFINIIGCLTLVPLIGIMGVVISLLVANFISALYLFIMAERKSKINFSFFELGFLPILLFIASLVLQNFLINIFVKILIFSVIFTLALILYRKELRFVLLKTRNH